VVVVAVVRDVDGTDDSSPAAMQAVDVGGGSSGMVFLFIAGGALMVSLILAGVVAAVWLRSRQPTEEE
jgi:hypothetical protein